METEKVHRNVTRDMMLVFQFPTHTDTHKQTIQERKRNNTVLKERSANRQKEKELFGWLYYNCSSNYSEFGWTAATVSVLFFSTLILFFFWSLCFFVLWYFLCIFFFRRTIKMERQGKVRQWRSCKANRQVYCGDSFAIQRCRSNFFFLVRRNWNGNRMEKTRTNNKKTIVSVLFGMTIEHNGQWFLVSFLYNSILCIFVLWALAENKLDTI